MKDLTLAVPVNSGNKFSIMLQILSAFKPFSELRRAELQVYSELLKLNDKYKDLSEDDRNMLVFSPENKKKIIKDLGLPKNSFYNILSSLRQKGILTHERFVGKYVIENSNQIIYKLVDSQ